MLSLSLRSVKAVKAHLERMFRSMDWADRQALEAVRHCPAAQSETLPLMAHLLAAEHVWLTRLEQREAQVAVWPTLGIRECQALAAENQDGYRAYLGRISDDQLVSKVAYRNTSGQPFETAVLDILTHVVLHGAYHRGQIARCIGRSGGVAANTDFITFVREIEPAGA
jgi:uncharacterized damage-inducible protein DinB